MSAYMLPYMSLCKLLYMSFCMISGCMKQRLGNSLNMPICTTRSILHSR